MSLKITNKGKEVRRLVQLGRAWRFPGFELPGQVLLAGGTQISDELGILRRQPVLQFIQSFDGRENGRGDFDSFHFHGRSVSQFAPKGKCFVRSRWLAC